MAKGPYWCRGCKSQFETQKLLGEHVRDLDHGWSCPLCEKKKYISHHWHVIEHCNAKHGGQELFFCFLCRLVFTSATALETHRNSHIPGQWSLRRYGDRDVGHAEESYYCRRCRQTFPSWTELSHHYENSDVHPKCSVCGHTSYNEALLESHMRFHPKCQICEEYCLDASDHLATFHNNEETTETGSESQTSESTASNVHEQQQAYVSVTQGQSSFPYPDEHGQSSSVQTIFSSAFGSSKSLAIRSPVSDDWDTVSQVSSVRAIGSVVADSAPMTETESNALFSITLSAEAPPSSASTLVETRQGKTRIEECPTETVYAVCDSNLPTQSTASPASKWCCRLCGKSPEQPIATVCQHTFCHGCIVEEMSKNLQCPVCNQVMLVRLSVQV